jgi:small subunit ribosomal protein S33
MAANRLSKLSPSFMKAIDASANRIFGNLPIVPYRTGFKLLRQKPIGPLVTNHYLPDMERSFRDSTNDFDTEIEERRKDSLVFMRRRGKGPPKKGQGKRASRKK